MKKRFLLCMLMTVMSFSVLTACGDDDSSSKKERDRKEKEHEEDEDKKESKKDKKKKDEEKIEEETTKEEVVEVIEEDVVEEVIEEEIVVNLDDPYDPSAVLPCGPKNPESFTYISVTKEEYLSLCEGSITLDEIVDSYTEAQTEAGMVQCEGTITYDGDEYTMSFRYDYQDWGFSVDMSETFNKRGELVLDSSVWFDVDSPDGEEEITELVQMHVIGGPDSRDFEVEKDSDGKIISITANRVNDDFCYRHSSYNNIDRAYNIHPYLIETHFENYDILWNGATTDVYDTAARKNEEKVDPRNVEVLEYNDQGKLAKIFHLFNYECYDGIFEDADGKTHSFDTIEEYFSFIMDYEASKDPDEYSADGFETDFRQYYDDNGNIIARCWTSGEYYYDIFLYE